MLRQCQATSPRLRPLPGPIWGGLLVAGIRAAWAVFWPWAWAVVHVGVGTGLAPNGDVAGFGGGGRCGPSLRASARIWAGCLGCLDGPARMPWPGMAGGPGIAGCPGIACCFGGGKGQRRAAQHDRHAQENQQAQGGRPALCALSHVPLPLGAARKKSRWPSAAAAVLKQPPCQNITCRICVKSAGRGGGAGPRVGKICAPAAQNAAGMALAHGAGSRGGGGGRNAWRRRSAP